MVPVVMDQLDSLRSATYSSQQDVKHLKERMRMFDATNTTQFGFGAAQTSFKQTIAGNTTGGFKQLQERSAANNANGQQSAAVGGAAQTPGGTGPPADANTDMKLVQVNSEKLKKLNSDPVAAFLDTVNQLEFIVNLPPTLNKDIRQIRVENFHRALFHKGSNGAFIKNELLKLKNGSREPLQVSNFNSCLKNMSYESMLHTVEDLLREHRFDTSGATNQ